MYEISVIIIQVFLNIKKGGKECKQRMKITRDLRNKPDEVTGFFNT
jgi:hypothetical protein